MWPQHFGSIITPLGLESESRYDLLFKPIGGAVSSDTSEWQHVLPTLLVTCSLSDGVAVLLGSMSCVHAPLDLSGPLD